MEKRKKVILTGFSVLHSILLLWATFFLLELNYSYGDETFLIKWSSIFKKVILGIDSKPPRNEYLFVNTSYDNMLIDKLDDEGLPLGNQAVTDREKLAHFFEVINKSPAFYKYIICDIFFENESSEDDKLQKELEKTRNIIIPYMQDETGALTLPVFNINKGLAVYNKISGSFLKYKLLRNDSLKTVPLKMYEDLHKTSLSRNGIFYFMNNKPALNNIIIDFKIRYYDILEERTNDPYPFVNLGELVSMPDSVILQSVKGKYILIGDLKERDIHNTAVGEMPGLLILLNTFLVLENGENIIGITVIIILLLAYLLISIDVFSSKSFTEREIVQKFTKNKAGKFFLKFLGYIMYLSVVSVIIYFINNIHINILLIAAYFKTFDSVLRYFRTPHTAVKNNIFSKLRNKIFIILNK